MSASTLLGLGCAACVGLAALGCEGPAPPAPPPCERTCQDGVAVRALRETMKLVYNLALQGKDVGAQDATVPCLRGGSARVFGVATSNAIQGTTDVALTYVFDRCTYLQKDDDAKESYDMTFSGTVEQKGTLAVSAGATTALLIKSASVSGAGTVYNPPLPYEARDCALEVSQNGGRLGGAFCGRDVGVDF